MLEGNAAAVINEVANEGDECSMNAHGSYFRSSRTVSTTKIPYPIMGFINHPKGGKFCCTQSSKVELMLFRFWSL